MSELHIAILRAFAIDVESAAIMADAASSVLRLAEERGIPQRIAIVNACAQLLCSVAGPDADVDDVQKAADLLSDVLEARLAYAKLQPSTREFAASAKGRAS
jgi:hypothetical protein